MSGILSSIPVAAQRLGFSGLLPFFGSAVCAFSSDPVIHEFSLRALAGYGAIILSFLGGVRWGLAMAVLAPDKLAIPLSLSILPSILGWAALLLPATSGLHLLAACFLALLLADLKLPAAPIWYRNLRLPLSIGAIAALIVGAAL